MATDIAFVMGVSALLGKRVPKAAKLFVLALAIADDIGAILVIALFYTADLASGWLLVGIAGLIVTWLGNRVGIRSFLFYVPVGVVVWYATYRSGVHPTIAGVALGLMTPVRSMYSARDFEDRASGILATFPVGDTLEDEEKSDYEAALLVDLARESISPVSRLEHRLLPWSSYLVIPLFAFVNAGIDFRVLTFEPANATVGLGVALGLVVGKTLGITGFSWLAIRTGLGRLPADTTWSQLIGLAILCGIGFTVSLFITYLAFTDAQLIDMAKLGVLTGSVIAALAAYSVIRSVTRHHR
jgi:NhaA family Na+:H+ antiporter